VTNEAQALRSIPFFSDLEPNDLSAIVHAGEHVSFEPGTAIVEAGAAGDAMYVILSGSAEVDVGGRYHVLSAGGVFGEMALISSQKRSATVQAKDAVEALRVPAEGFREFLLKHPSIAVGMLESMATRLREVQGRLDGWIGCVASDGLATTSTGDLQCGGARPHRPEGKERTVVRLVGSIALAVLIASAPIPAFGLSPAGRPDLHWTGESNQAGAFYGTSVANAGDVNADGFDDLVVGAIFYDHGETDEGAAFLYLGSPSGPGSTPNWMAEGNQQSAFLGNSVAGAGDVNGDGYDDVIVGAPYESNGPSLEGQAFVYEGSPSGLSQTPSWTVESNQAEAYLGYAVSGAGDVNGDGYADVIVGSFTYDNGQTDEGAAFVYLGSASGLATTPVWSTESNQASAQLGTSVGTAGDVNGDGYDDVVVGAPLFDGGQTDEGEAMLFLGSPSGPSATPQWTVEGNQTNAHFGISISGAGDTNGDGFDDVIAGGDGYGFGQQGEGRAVVFPGSASGLSQSTIWVGEGNQAGAHFGFAVASAGNVNGDGFGDVIVGAYGYDHGQTDEGRAFIFFGSSHGPAGAPRTAEGNQAGADFGFSVASAGRPAGGLYDQIIVGARRADHPEVDEGTATVLGRS